MPNNLKGLIEENLNANGRLINRGERKSRNQKIKEVNLKRKLKKGFTYTTILFVLILGGYGVKSCLHKHDDYISKQKKKMVLYQKRFDDIKYFYDRKDYFKADDLSERLQEELSKERFFSPTNELYKKVEDYDDKLIDPEIKRIRREQFYKKLQEIPRNIFNKLEEKLHNMLQRRY